MGYAVVASGAPISPDRPLRFCLSAALRLFCLFFLSLLAFSAVAQRAAVRGRLTTADNEPARHAVVVLQVAGRAVARAELMLDGRFELREITPGTYQFVAYADGYPAVARPLEVVAPETRADVVLTGFTTELATATVRAEREKTFGATRLNAVENFGLYEGKKTEVVELRDLTANLATNNARQVFGRVVGLNIWESDGAGLQLGIGGRGLSPNRTANFNVRQNGYDISADALGYPEAYYTPPTEALERIEVVRGAASLQYGTQFGGMLNFRFRRGPTDQKLQLTTRQTVGPWGFLGSFNSVGGTVGKTDYYAFFQRKQGNGWRPNSGFAVNTGYAQVGYQLTEKLHVNGEITLMHYLAQQPGGLSDRMFADDPRQSVRPRNWFQVDWKLAAATFTYAFTDRTRLNSRTFGLLASRESLGNLERINVADAVVKNRTIIDGEFENIGNETRLLHRYGAAGQNHLLVGTRVYRGLTTARQGDGSPGADANFGFLNPNNLENSDFRFPNYNLAAFAENIFQLTPTLTLTPGVRWESISTRSEGYYTQRVLDFAGNLLSSNALRDDRRRDRSFVLFGVGGSWKPVERLEAYANISQNYRAINFTDLRIVNANFVVDPNLRDETGYTADAGVRGGQPGVFTFDASVFLLRYNDRIGQLLKADQPPLYLDYRRRQNIADSRNLGVELFGEVNLLGLGAAPPTPRRPTLTVFANLALVDARYVNTQDNTIRGKQVEMVPPVVLRTGTSFRRGPASASAQFSYVSEHFSDATNARRTATAIEGVIPAYHVVDVSAAYTWRWLTAEASVNNLLNARYFTRRAEAYPGPGIIPSDGRGAYLTVQAVW